MTKSAALEFVGDNIHINAICPGMFDTNLFERFVPKEVWEPLVDLVPVKRFGKPKEIAYGTVFLASDESSFMTGTDLVIDGGYTCPYALSPIAAPVHRGSSPVYDVIKAEARSPTAAREGSDLSRQPELRANLVTVPDRSTFGQEFRRDILETYWP